MNDDGTLSPEGPEPWSEVDREVTPPPELRDRVVSQLRERGELDRRAKVGSEGTPPDPAGSVGDPAGTGGTLRIAAGIALALLVGGLVGRASAPVVTSPVSGPGTTSPASDAEPTPAAVGTASQEERFVLFLYEDDRFQPDRSHAELVAEYTEWAVELAAEGDLVLAHELDEDAWVAIGSASAPVSTRARPTGLFVIRAGSLEAARAVAEGSPHVRYGGTVVVHRAIP